MWPTLPRLFRKMTICSSINYPRISGRNCDYDSVKIAAQSRGVQVKCSCQIIQAGVLMFMCSALLWGQSLRSRPAEPTRQPSSAIPLPTPVGSISLTVSAGIPLKVTLDSEVRIRKVGQAIRGKTTEPVFAFDKLLIPAGTVVNGKVSTIDQVPTKTRLLDATGYVTCTCSLMSS